MNGLRGLVTRLNEIKEYLENVISGRLPMNHQIAHNLQDIINLLPNLNVEELVKAMLVKTNDMHLVMYISSLIRSVLALHDLLNNKIKYKDMDDILDRDAGLDVSTTTSKKEKETNNNNGNGNNAEKKGPSTPTSNKE